MITMRIVLVLDVEKVAYELPSHFAKFRAPQANNDASTPSANVQKTFF